MGPLPVVRADREMLKLAISNVLGNALKYSSGRDKSIIHVACKELEERYEIAVCDNGVGFDMEYKNKVFEIFQRLHDEDEFEGSGVGMAIVKKIIERHGGKVWITSELDKGTNVYFSIPK